jgi:hypothetical protein
MRSLNAFADGIMCQPNYIGPKGEKARPSGRTFSRQGEEQGSPVHSD